MDSLDKQIDAFPKAMELSSADRIDIFAALLIEIICEEL